MERMPRSSRSSRSHALHGDAVWMRRILFHFHTVLHSMILSGLRHRHVRVPMRRMGTRVGIARIKLIKTASPLYSHLSIRKLTLKKPLLAPVTCNLNRLPEGDEAVSLQLKQKVFDVELEEVATGRAIPRTGFYGSSRSHAPHGNAGWMRRIESPLHASVWPLYLLGLRRRRGWVPMRRMGTRMSQGGFIFRQASLTHSDIDILRIVINRLRIQAG